MGGVPGVPSWQEMVGNHAEMHGDESWMTAAPARDGQQEGEGGGWVEEECAA